MKKGFIVFLLFLVAISLCACADEATVTTTMPITTTTAEEIVDVEIISSVTHDRYVYKERLKIISTEQEANEVSEFFIMNLGKDDILSSFLNDDIFEEYSLLTGYVNVSFLDESITIEKVTKESDIITVQLSSDFDYDSKSLSDQANLNYVYFIVQVDKQVVDLSSTLNVEFISDSAENQISTYEFSDQPAYISDIQIEGISEFIDLEYEGPILEIDSVDSFNLIKDSIVDSGDLNDLTHNATYFETHSYIFASYTYSYEPIVKIIGLEILDAELQIVVTGNAPENIQPMLKTKYTKLFVIAVLKTTLENVESYSYKNHNLYNGDNRGIIDNNNISDTYELIDFELTDSITDKQFPFFTCSIRSVEELNDTIQAWESSIYYGITHLNDYMFDTEFFNDNQIVLLPFTNSFSLSGVTVSEIRNYGSYYEIIITTSDSEFTDKSWGMYEEDFIISISNNLLNEEPIFINSLTYLGDQ